MMTILLVLLCILTYLAVVFESDKKSERRERRSNEDVTSVGHWTGQTVIMLGQSFDQSDWQYYRVWLSSGHCNQSWSCD